MSHTPLSPMDELERLRVENEKLRATADHFETLWQRLSSLIGKSPLVAWIKNAAGEYCYVSERLCRLLGRPADELLWRTDFEVLPTYAALQAHKAEAQAMNSPDPVESIETFTSADGLASQWKVIRFAISGSQNEMLVGAIAILLSSLG